MSQVVFEPYFLAAGASQDEARRLSREITTWEGLHAWLDLYSPPPSEMMPDRSPVGSPKLPIDWKENVWHSLRPNTNNKVDIDSAKEWESVILYRQRLCFVVGLILTISMVALSYSTLEAQKLSPTAMKFYLVVYSIMTFLLASNFCKLMLGTWHAVRGPKSNPWHPFHTLRDPDPSTKVAIVFPVYHEDMARVGAGIAATWLSIAQNHPEFLHHFDVVILSDSRKLEFQLNENKIFYELKNKLPTMRLFYRRRPSNINAKLGNITDFCRRWGRRYKYMLVMDADSVMEGQAIIKLLQMMEGRPTIGILQTNPTPILRVSLFGRMQQFAGRLYGSVFSYSLQALNMGHASYIGHNALIRIDPFIRHCMLPDLPGRPPWGGKPLSHDILESALMARAGFEVWFLPEVDGTFEEVPANLVAFLIRERRWMQGNLQHLRFLALRGLRPVHRETLFTGALGYFSAPLWAFFLVLSAYGMISFAGKDFMTLQNVETVQIPVFLLLLSSIVFLFMPRVLAIAVQIINKKSHLYGGKDKLFFSLFFETIFSFFMSPIVMVFITWFIWLWWKRQGVSWGNQQRDDSPLSYRDCIRYFGWASLIGFLGWAWLVHAVYQIPDVQLILLETVSGGWLTPGSILIWFFPVLGGIAGSVVIARLTSLTFPSLRARHLFCTPEEIVQPKVITDLLVWEAILRPSVPDMETTDLNIFGHLRDPRFYVRHRATLRHRPVIAASIVTSIKEGQPLNERALSLALRERASFESLHALLLKHELGAAGQRSHLSSLAKQRLSSL